jgi:hypothetical protein
MGAIFLGTVAMAGYEVQIRNYWWTRRVGCAFVFLVVLSHFWLWGPTRKVRRLLRVWRTYLGHCPPCSTSRIRFWALLVEGQCIVKLVDHDCWCVSHVGCVRWCFHFWMVSEVVLVWGGVLEYGKAVGQTRHKSQSMLSPMLFSSSLFILSLSLTCYGLLLCYRMISRYMRKLWDTSFAQEAKVFGVLKQVFP